MAIAVSFLRFKFFLLYLTLFKAVRCFQDACPPACDCFGTIIDCSNNGLNEVPEDIPTWVEELNLSQNPDLQFGNESLPSLPLLTKLTLDEMELTSIPEFGELSILKSLSLCGNALSDAAANWSRDFPNLHDLDLTKNSFRRLDFSEISGIPLRKIDFKANSISSILPNSSLSLSTIMDLRLSRNQIDDAAFRNLSILFNHLTNLKSLDLNRNLMEKPQGLMFQNLTGLTVLKLKRNKIVELPAGVFYGLKALTTLRLDNNSNITEISNGWLFDQHSLKVLSLSHNNIGQIKENAWEATGKLTILDISFNQLGCRHTEPIFKGLNNLQELYLSHNCFAILDADTFGHLSKLKILDLSNNQLQGSAEYSTEAFRGLKSLESLNLAYNKIETIHTKVFLLLTSLTTLDLSGNNLKTLPHNPFRSMSQLSKLYLNTTNLVCDCQMSWLPEWLSTQSLTGVKSTCGFPEALKGKPIVRMKQSDFSCDNSPQTIILVSPKNQTALYGKNMTLECVAYAGGDKPSFTWTKDRKVVEPFRIKEFMSVDPAVDGQETVTKIISQLFIENVTHSHAGSYQCIARNTYGPSYSPQANVVVHRFPYFTQKPISVEVKEGGAVELKCAASGYPLPEILLNKEGDFPAPREKRLFYSPNVYFIKPILPRDDGIYVCTARNEAGAINITARVSVIHTPNFSRPVHNQAAAIGQSIALECQGTGQPKPKVTWYKEGKLLAADDNHVLLEEGHFLLLLHVQMEDIGTYLCELTNRLGTQRRKLTLSLKQDVFLPALTGFVIIILVTSVVVTSCFWVVVIYLMKKRSRHRGERARGLNQILQEPLNPNLMRGGKIMVGDTTVTNVTPLLTTSNHIDGYITTIGQDSSSEHSSGKDSGVGESAQRSNEDLHPNGDLRPGMRRSLIYLDSTSNGPCLKGQSSIMRVAGDEIRPRLSTFGLQTLDSNRSNSYNSSYASLRRGSASRLLPVPSPVTPGMGMNSLPRHAYRSHSNSLSQMKYPYPDQFTSSLSRRRPPHNSIAFHSNTSSPTSFTRRESVSRRREEGSLSPSSDNDQLPPIKSPSSNQEHLRETPPIYSSFKTAERSKHTPAAPSAHFLPSR